MQKDSILVITTKDLPQKTRKWWSQFNVVVAPEELMSAIEKYGSSCVNVEDYLESETIYEASSLAEEISGLELPNGKRVSKLFLYKGFELWWIYYNSLFFYFTLPYTKYRKLLEYLKNFKNVYLFEPQYKTLFSRYLEAYGRTVHIVRKKGFKSPSFLPFGILVQIMLTVVCLPVLMLKKNRIMVFIGDKFEKGKDYDFRMKYLYEELRARKLPFVEFVRSLESWKTVLSHALVRKRPVIYSEAVAFVGKFLSFVSGSRRKVRKEFGAHLFASETNPEERFKLLLALEPLRNIYDDVWGVRIMQGILRVIGVKATYVTTALERNFQAVIGSKINNIRTVGILHGAAPKDYIVYDFLPGFTGEKILSVDKYGMWSEWWKEYYAKHSKAYRSEQLYVSGLMRPLEDKIESKKPVGTSTGPIKVLFISEQLAVPQEVLPYLKELMKNEDIDFTIKFRPYRDGFEEWLQKNESSILEDKNIKIVRGRIEDAVKDCEVTVGSHSTAVLEALLQSRVPILFDTPKWGDCFSLKEYGDEHPFFAENPQELIERINSVRSIPNTTLSDLLARYFGDPYRNGSAWVVDQLEEAVLKGNRTK